MTAFDATDRKYQVKEEFQPNKESTWPFPKEKDGWAHTHTALRWELSRLSEALEATKQRGPVKKWEVKCVGQAWKAHQEHIKSHNKNGEESYVPWMKSRFHYPEHTDNEALENQMQRVGSTVDNLSAGAQVDSLCEQLVEYEKVLLPRFQLEQDVCLPLFRAYFLPSEGRPKVREVAMKGPKIEMGSMIYSMGEETFRNDFMKQEEIPWFAWQADLSWKLSHFKKHFVVPIEALKSGQEP